MNTQQSKSVAFEPLEFRRLMSTYYLAPTGSDSGAGSSAAPWASLSKAYSIMQSGDTVVLKDGTYNKLVVFARNVLPAWGTANAFTRIVAEHAGGAIIDGQDAMSPILINGQWLQSGYNLRYVEVNGLVFRNQSAGMQTFLVDHMKFLNCGFEDSNDGNGSVVSLSWNSDNILMEDCYAWGSGRYKYLAYHANNVVFRRCIARMDRVVATESVIMPIASYAAYGASNVAFQNCISIDGDKPEYWDVARPEFGGSFYIPSTDGPTSNITIAGSIALNVDMQFGGLAPNLNNIKIVDSVGWHIREGIFARDSLTMDHNTFGDLYGPSIQVPNIGFQWYPGDVHPTNTTKMTNSILTNINGTALTTWATENYNVFWGNDVNRGAGGGTLNLPMTPTGANSVNADPGLKYILRTSDGSAAIDNKGSDGKDIGANIVYQIGTSGSFYGESGYDTVTGVALWPWPNEQIIGNIMRSYSYEGLSGNRGFAATGQTLTNYIWTWLGNPNPYATGSTPQTPTAPSGLTASVVSSSQINLTWSDNSSNETGFLLERQSGSGSWVQIAQLAAGVTSYSNTGLTSATAYSYRVRATNANGNSGYGATASATTTSSTTIPSAPSGLAVSAESATVITLTWTDNSNDETGFLVERQTGSGSFTQVASLGAGSNSYTSSGLTASTQYTFRVRATNSAGNSSCSNTATATTPVAPPAVPTGLTATANSTTQVSISWTDASSTETGFLIERRTGSGTYSQIATVGANVTSYTNTGLTANTQYTYRVRATNAGGNSSYSATAVVQTPPAVPLTPTNLAATVNSATQVALAWTDASNNETGFLVERRTGSGSYAQIASVAAGTTTYTDSTATANTQYTYRVRATNSAGNSSYSNTATVTTLQSTPATPTLLIAAAGDATQVDLDWTDNASNETGFLIERRTGTGSYAQIATVGANVSAYTDTTVAANTQYTYRVRATNAAGNSSYSNTAVVQTPQNVLTAPSSLAVQLASATEAELTWTDNSSTETGFLIERRIGTGNYTQIATVGADITSYTNSGLSSDTQYGYRVRATNGSGNSGYSNTATVQTAQTLPSAPSSFSADASDSTQVDLSWNDNSSNETGFLIERKTGTGSYSQIATVGAGVESYTDTSVSAGTQYTYRVRATNGAGNSAYSNTGAVMTPATQPGAPSNLSAQATSQTQISLTWTDNSANETGFVIERVNTSGSFTPIATVQANSEAFTDNGLEADSEYTYRVSALNGAGSSPHSNTVTLRTAPPADVAGNTMESAKVIGDITPGRVRVIDEYVGPGDRYDYHRIDISSPVSLELKLMNQTGNADLQLFDSSGQRIGYSKHGDTSGEFLALDLLPGAYYVRVICTSGVGGTYRLRMEATDFTVNAEDPLASAPDMGNLGQNVIKAVDGTIDSSDRNAHYRFTVNQSTSIYAKLYNLTDNADLMLLDSSGQRIALSKRGDTGIEALRLTLAPGTYFLRVIFRGTDSTPYRLRLASEGA